MTAWVLKMESIGIERNYKKCPKDFHDFFKNLYVGLIRNFLASGNKNNSRNI